MKLLIVLFCITFLAVYGADEFETTTTSTTPKPHRNSTSFTDAVVGQATFYDISVGFTACGTMERDDDLIVAVSPDRWTTPNPNLDPLCQRSVRITNPRTRITIVCKIKDKCPSCPPQNLDLTRGAFRALGEEFAKGRFAITWDMN